MRTFLVVALEWRAQAKSKVVEAHALQALRQEVAALKEEKESWACQEEKAKGKLFDNMVDTFAEGFKKALAQASCENLGIDTSNCNPLHHIVDGKVVPLDLGD